MATIVFCRTTPTFSCEAGPNSAPECSIPCADNFDYLGDMCTGTLTGRGTEMDWLRFWWDFLTDRAVSFTTCAAIYHTAVTGGYVNPPAPAWDATPETGTPNADRPIVHFTEAATALSRFADWDAVDDLNGIHR